MSHDDQGTGEGDQLNVIFKTIGTPSEHSWPEYPTHPAVMSGIFKLQEHHTMTLDADGTLVKMPKSSLRKKFPAEGYTPSTDSLSSHRTTALSDLGTCSPPAIAALSGLWITLQPNLPWIRGGKAVSRFLRLPQP